MYSLVELRGTDSPAPAISLLGWMFSVVICLRKDRSTVLDVRWSISIHNVS
jgi:hypothetical protein